MAPVTDSPPAVVALDPQAAAAEIIAAAQAMVASGLVVGMTGNVSARVDDGFLITPTRTPYAGLDADGLAHLGLDGAPLTPGVVASKEWALHAAIYRARPDVSGVVHTHSVHATAWSFLGEPLAPSTEDIAYYGIGRIRTARHASAGSAALGENAVRALGHSAAALLARHGVVATGGSPLDALTVARVVEHQAHLAWLLRASIAPW